MKKLWFIHLPKTGGVFLRNYFGEYYSDDIKMFPVEVHAHDGVSDLKNYINFYRFGFVRNPWDYRLATYFYPQRIHEGSWLKKFSTFEMFIKNTYNSDYLQFTKYIKLFCIDGEMVMNYIGKLETLDSDIRKIFEINNIEMTISINEYYKKNKDNVDIRNHSPHEHYSKYYTDELIDIVYEQEKEIIEMYDYKFEGMDK